MMKTETGTVADPMWRPVATQQHASRRGRGRLMIAITSQQSAPATPAVRESWPGARRRKGKRRNVQEVSPAALPAWEGARRREAMGSQDNVFRKQKQMTKRSSIASTER